MTPVRMRFVHLADAHLDAPFAGRSPEVRERLREASRDALRRAVDLALEVDAHAFLVAGDLFDGERLSFETERFLLDQLRRLTEAGIVTVYATGNHDPGRVGHRSQALEWPAGMVVADSHEPVRVDVERSDGERVGRITAAGHETDRESRDLAAELPEADAPVPEVALLHTQVVGARAGDEHDRYAPTELETLEGKGYDYWALGHVHLRQRLSRKPAIWYAGTLQGRDPGETGAKGVLLVDVEKDGATVEFRPLAPVRWEELVLKNLDDVRTLDALTGRVEAAWSDARSEDPGLPGTGWMLRIELRGPCPLHRELGLEEDRKALEGELSARLDLLDAEVRAGDVHPPVDPDDHRERQDALGEALRLLREVAEDDQALRDLRPDELAAAPRDQTVYLRSLLDGLAGELTARMLADSGEESR